MKFAIYSLLSVFLLQCVTAGPLLPKDGQLVWSNLICLTISGCIRILDATQCCAYYCSVNRNNKHHVVYPDLPSARRPVLHGPEVPIPERPANLDNFEENDHEFEEIDMSSSYIASNSELQQPNPLNQAQLNDLTRDLGLSTESDQLLGSRLAENRLLSPGTTYYWYRSRDIEFRQFFAFHENTMLVYCTNISELIEALGLPYKPEEWRLFIDSPRRSLKAVLLHIENKAASVPVAHSVQLKENYETMKTLLDALKYNFHEWKICGDLKVVSLILGMQGGYTKYPCFLCLWDSRADEQHYSRQEWPSRQYFAPGSHNVIYKPIVNRNKILLPPLHIKLGLMRSFVRALKKDSQAFLFLARKFPQVSDAKLTAGIFDGPQIRILMKDAGFAEVMSETERNAWESFKALSLYFLGNHKSPEYETIVKVLIQNFEILGVRMSIKLHFLRSHLDYFPENCGDYSEEQGERFHQDIKCMEERYQGRWDINMLADYCWCLKRDSPVQKHKRKSIKSSFI